jgi:antitoxin Phd
MMNTWPVQDAKSRFSELLDNCVRDGAQLITKRGTETAVLLPIAEWRRLQSQTKLSLKELLLSDEARFDLQIVARGKAKRRTSAFL